MRSTVGWKIRSFKHQKPLTGWENAIKEKGNIHKLDMLRAIRKPKTELQTVPELDPKRDRNLHAGFTVKTGYIR